MKRSSTAFLQIIVALIGVGSLAFLLWEPHIEGRNQHAAPLEIYFNDPFLAYVYVGSIPLFVALYQAYKVLGYAGQNKIFSETAVKALRTIKHCALAIIGFVAVSVIFFLFSDPDDRPQGVILRILVTFSFLVVAAAADTFEKILQNAVEIKSENDVTV